MYVISDISSMEVKNKARSNKDPHLMKERGRFYVSMSV
jgi:hypothetical protein